MSTNSNFFRDYYLDCYQECSNYINAYVNTYERMVGLDRTRTNIRNISELIDAWDDDFEQEEMGIGPQFTIKVEELGGFVDSSGDVHEDFMIEAAYRDYILQIINPNNNINFDTSDINVARQIKIKVTQYLGFVSTVRVNQ